MSDYRILLQINEHNYIEEELRELFDEFKIDNVYSFGISLLDALNKANLNAYQELIDEQEMEMAEEDDYEEILFKHV